ncbi:hypothetical protein B0H15DRAFT_932558 [Mycena belliarum]|uniref:Uncharacterized protein n=1 Tax=Mycena belliarum TaxID=1033014 RepID=A0AAD6U1R3_9AGAR|nr:hypothetical protein B0H15DRAFT_932558 [Mycena belliae]
MLEDDLEELWGTLEGWRTTRIFCGLGLDGATHSSRSSGSSLSKDLINTHDSVPVRRVWDTANVAPASPSPAPALSRSSCLPSFSAFSLSPAVFRLPFIEADATADLEPPALPLLRALSRSYTSPPAALALLKIFGATPRLVELTLDDAEVSGFGSSSVAALIARVLPTRPGATAPFPALARLTLRGALYLPTMAARDAEFIIGGVRVCVVRPAYAYADDDADADADSMYADDSFSDSDEGSVSEAGSEMGVEAEMGVKEDDAEDGSTNSGDAEAHNAYACAWSKRSAASWVFAEAAAFRRGGVLNDPLFDARWAGVVV